MLKWLAINGGLTFSLYQAGVNNIAGFANILQFFVWALFGASLTLLSETARAEMRARKKGAVPRWLDGTFNFAFTLGLAWLGWFWTATAFLIAWHLIWHARDTSTPTTTEGEKPCP